MTSVHAPIELTHGPIVKAILCVLPVMGFCFIMTAGLMGLLIG